MKHNWILIAGIVSVLAIPFGLAAFEDSTRESAEDRFRKARAAGDDEAQMRALDDMTGEEMVRMAEEGLLDEDPHSDDDIAEWERDEPLDISFIDKYLAADRPGLAGDLAAVAELDRPVSADAHGFDEDLEHLTVVFSPLGDDHEAALAGLMMRFERDTRVEDKLTRKYGAGESSTGARLWHDPDNKVKVTLLTSDDDRWTIGVARYGELDPLFELFDAKRGLLGKQNIWDDELRRLAPLASREQYVVVELSSDGDGRIEEISMTVDLSLIDGAVASAETQLAKRFGASSGETIGNMRELSFARQRGLAAYVYADRIVLTRRRLSD